MPRKNQTIVCLKLAFHSFQKTKDVSATHNAIKQIRKGAVSIHKIFFLQTEFFAEF